MYDDLIKHFGNKKKLAESLGISNISVQKWKTIPPLRAYEIEILTKGKFKFKSLIKIDFQAHIKRQKGKK